MSSVWRLGGRIDKSVIEKNWEVQEEDRRGFEDGNVGLVMHVEVIAPFGHALRVLTVRS